MMKVSDPILFGHAVQTFFADVFAKHAAALESVGANPNDGLGDVLARVANLPDAERAAVEADIDAAIAAGPAIAMVDSDNGITNLHVPSDIIVDASMPAMIRDSGKMWNAAGERQDCKAVIPDSSLRRCVRGGDRRLPGATARSTRRRWARCPTSASWPRRPRSTARTTRPSRSRPTARCAW